MEFCNDIFRVSGDTTDGFVSFTKEVISSSVKVLRQNDLFPPCHFAVIALGSVAQGEATPYSDLEYAFTVEYEDEYFTKLAVDSYFRIGNLCESHLGTFDIAELAECVLSTLDPPVGGFRIDGIKRHAGNIPTGTGRPDGERLILTEDGFMELYKRSALAPFDGFAGKDDMIASSALIYSSEGSSSTLYNRLQQAIKGYKWSDSGSKLIARNRKKLNLFVHDIEQHNYLPENTRVHTAGYVAIKVKTHIFRYPTLLVNNLSICMSIFSSRSWDVLDVLKSFRLLSEENYAHLQIILALSIYIRAQSYISFGSYTDVVSLYTSSVVDEKGLYHVPQNLFIILGCVLIPIKRSIRSSLRQCYHSLKL